MKPLFPFYGSKWRDAKRYPSPREIVVEPFAGSAGYSIYWGVPTAYLYDVDPIIVGLWSYLINATEREILALPDLEVGETVDDFNLPQEARWLIGFWLNRGSAQPKKTKTAFSARTERSQLIWGERARERIAGQLEGVRNWHIRQCSYADIDPLLRAMWFVDPPYAGKGKYYRFHDVDYLHLAEWIGHLPGSVAVCENEGADWLPFKPLAEIKSTRGVSREAVYIREAA